MPRPLRIDFVSDISCPWCVIGLRGLEQALAKTADLVDAEIHIQPFELNPEMGPEGENVTERLLTQYRMTPEDMAKRRAEMRERAANLGFTMATSEKTRLYNTFDAHRLLHWAGVDSQGTGAQRALKHALLEANFTEQQVMSDHDVLVAAAVKAGLDGDAAREVLVSGRYTQEVRAEEALWRSRGISSVPAIILDERYLISGGQPPEAFEQALRQLAAQPA